MHSLAAGRAAHAGQILKKMPDKEKYPGPPGLNLGVGLTFSTRKRSIVSKLQQSGGHGPKTGRNPIEEGENLALLFINCVSVSLTKLLVYILSPAISRYVYVLRLLIWIIPPCVPYFLYEFFAESSLR